MIPKKYFALVMSAVMSIIMGLAMSGIITAINTGVDAGFVGRWLRSFAIAAPIAFVSMQFMRPLAMKIAAAITDSGDISE